MTFLWPNGSTTIPRVTSEWNPARKNPVTGIIQPHNGVDVIGFPVNLSCSSGVVTFARYNGGAGNEVRVRHDDGSESRYKHNARILVRVGQRVSAKTPLGVMGTTGQSTGIHLHFETRTSPTSYSVNPRVFMAAKMSIADSYIPLEEEVMVKLIKRVGEKTPEWSAFAVPLHGPTELERGYILVDEATALGLARTYDNGGGTEKEETRAPYITEQNAARVLHAAYPCPFCKPELVGGGSTGPAFDSKPILEAIAALPGAVAKAVRALIIRD